MTTQLQEQTDLDAGQRRWTADRALLPSGTATVEVVDGVRISVDAANPADVLGVEVPLGPDGAAGPDLLAALARLLDVDLSALARGGPLDVASRDRLGRLALAAELTESAMVQGKDNPWWHAEVGALRDELGLPPASAGPGDVLLAAAARTDEMPADLAGADPVFAVVQDWLSRQAVVDLVAPGQAPLLDLDRAADSLAQSDADWGRPTWIGATGDDAEGHMLAVPEVELTLPDELLFAEEPPNSVIGLVHVDPHPVPPGVLDMSMGWVVEFRPDEHVVVVSALLQDGATDDQVANCWVAVTDAVSGRPVGIGSFEPDAAGGRAEARITVAGTRYVDDLAVSGGTEAHPLTARQLRAGRAAANLSRLADRAERLGEVSLALELREASRQRWASAGVEVAVPMSTPAGQMVPFLGDLVG
ncbi:MAG: hypothetical protein ACKO04_09025 [Actinomycetes bacterium]